MRDIIAHARTARENPARPWRSVCTWSMI